MFQDQAGYASKPILPRNKGSDTQSTYHGLRRQGTDCNKGLVDPGSIKLSCLYPITYIPHLNVGGRIKQGQEILQGVAFYLKTNNKGCTDFFTILSILEL
jgi:hypothetical protein